MTTRRTVLVTTAALGAAAATGAGVWAWTSGGHGPAPDPLDATLSSDDRWAGVRAHLREHFAYLDLPDATLDAFLDAAKAHHKLPKGPDGLAFLRRQLLMSTDFLLKGGDESRPVGFVAWYDPYETPCWNPLARGPEGV